MSKEKQHTTSEEVASLKEEVEHLRRVNAMKDRLFSIISHDIRSPLNTLSSLVDTLIKYSDAFSPEEIKRFSLDVKDSLHSVRFLLENLLQWSLSQMDRIEHKPDWIDLKEIVDRNFHLFEPMARTKNIQLQVDFRSEQQVFADKDMLDFVLRNLLSNALKFTEKEGLIEVSTYSKEGFVHVSVKDDGVGMDEATQKAVFDRDTLVSTFGTSSEKGTGLGLVMCKEFVQIGGGDVFVESELGKGSKFIFTIPEKSQ